MNPLEDRYSRQRRLASFGAEGQRRLESASFYVGTGPGASVELSYLCRAGAQRVRIGPMPKQPAFRHANSFEFAAARNFADGAWRASLQIQAAIAELDADAATPTTSTQP